MKSAGKLLPKRLLLKITVLANDAVIAITEIILFIVARCQLPV